VATTGTRGTLTLLSRLSKASIRATPESSLGMSLREYLALSYVADPGGISQQQLSEILCIDANNTVLLLNELETKSLVQRLRDPADRRRHLVQMTTAGRVAYERAQRAREAAENEILSALSHDERDQLHELLAKALGD
jgi:DNA-binding MarR family transcriptional regulator